MRIKASALFFLLLFALVAGGLFWKFYRIQGPDFLVYEELQKSALQFQKQEGLALMASSEQMRKKVVKELWWGEVNPLYLRIECSNSKLLAMKEKEKYEVMEKMKGVKCLIQEELFYLLPDGRRAHFNEEGEVVVKEEGRELLLDPTLKTLIPMQEIRYVEAKEGYLSYSKLEFIGEEVTVYRYRLRGHTPPPFCFDQYTPLATGQGKRVVFHFKEGKVDLRLEGMKATFNPREGI